MKLRTGLIGLGAAAFFAFSAQMAAASPAQCSGGGNGGGETPIEVTPGDDPSCPPSGSAFVSTTAYTANNTAYNVNAEVPAGNDYLQVGEVVEVEVDVGTVVAALNSNPKEALEVAQALGIRSSVADTKPGAVDAVGGAKRSSKLTEAEVEEVANYIFASMQQSGGRATGRSDPAPNSWTSRVIATGQAIQRAWNSFTASLPNSFNASMRHTTFHSNGAKKSETVMQIEVTRQE